MKTVFEFLSEEEGARLDPRRFRQRSVLWMVFSRLLDVLSDCTEVLTV